MFVCVEQNQTFLHADNKQVFFWSYIVMYRAILLCVVRHHCCCPPCLNWACWVAITGTRPIQFDHVCHHVLRATSHYLHYVNTFNIVLHVTTFTWNTLFSLRTRIFLPTCRVKWNVGPEERLCFRTLKRPARTCISGSRWNCKFYIKIAHRVVISKVYTYIQSLQI